MLEHVLIVGLTFTEGSRAATLGVWTRNFQGQPRVWGECLNVRGSKEGPYLTGSINELVAACLPPMELPAEISAAVRAKLVERGVLARTQAALQSPLVPMFRAIGQLKYPQETAFNLNQLLGLLVGHVVRINFDRGRPAMQEQAILRSDLDGSTTWAGKPVKEWIERFEGTPGCHEIMGRSAQLRALLESGKLVEMTDDDEDEDEEESSD